jgi:tRNA U34 5-carboxymethylaminomethyl modifying enzyme MnmG/GidA
MVRYYDWYFLNGLIHIGSSNYQAGRRAEEGNKFVILGPLGIQLGRLKTYPTQTFAFEP